jgi:multicomponent Na+:H+ antiporter subunit C
MENVLAIAVGLLVACAVYLILSRDLMRVMLGFLILSNGVNLLIFTAGRVTRDAPPLITNGHGAAVHATANPLPQALILTAIVIGFSLTAFALVLTYRAYVAMRTIDVDAMRLAEPPGEGQSMPEPGDAPSATAGKPREHADVKEAAQ